MKFSLIFLFFLFLPSFAFSADLSVKIDSLRNDKGHLLVELYASREGFPGDSDKVFQKVKAVIKDGTAEAFFSGLKLKEYAVIIFHDENNNEKLDFQWFPPKPLEGVGVSNDAKGFFGPPKFEDAKFKLDKKSQEIKIKINYF